MTVLPRDADENVHIVRVEFVRRQKYFERFLGLKLFVELVAFCDQGVGVFRPHRRSAPETERRAKQTESAEEMIRIHGCK